MFEEKRVNCFFCMQQCGMVATVEDNRVVEVQPDPDHVVNPSYCVRWKAIMEFHDHPWRINYALKRVGERGQGRWEKIPYARALDEVAEKLGEIKEKFGPEAVAFGEGTYRTYVWAKARFMRSFGSLNEFGAGAVCYIPQWLVQGALYGYTTSGGFPVRLEGERACCIVMVGANKDQSFPVQWMATLDAMKSGAKLIVIDPRYTEPASVADLWLQPRPATDAIILLSWLNIIVDKELFDRAFVERWTNGCHLIRTDNNKPLTEADMERSGRDDVFYVWDSTSRDVRRYDPSTLSYESPDVKPLLEASCEITLFDTSKVKCKTVWQLLKERLSQYPPEKAEEISWVSAKKIEEAAVMYARNTPGFILWSVAQEQIGRSSAQVARCIAHLRTVTGNLDKEGGELLGQTGLMCRIISDHDLEVYENPRKRERKFECLTDPKIKQKQLGSDTFRLIGWQGWDLLCKYMPKTNYTRAIPTGSHNLASNAFVWRAMIEGKPYPVKAIINSATNFLVQMPNIPTAYKAMKNMEFSIYVGYFPTPTSMISDYVFPAADWLERPEINTHFGMGNFLWVGERAVKPSYDRHDDYYFWRGLAVRLGLEKYWPWGCAEEALDYIIRDMGLGRFEELARSRKRWYIGPSEFKKYESQGFGTPSRKAELYSNIFEKLGYDPLPYYQEPAESPISTPMLYKEYPFICITGIRVQCYYHSEHRQISLLRRLHPDPLVEIHPRPARELGIRDGDWVYIESPRGKCMMKAKVTPRVHPKVVALDHGWWLPEEQGEEPSLYGLWRVCQNLLTTDEPTHCDPFTGGYPLKGFLCKVYKA